MRVQNPKNILVRMPNWLGDAVMATPILHDLKTAFPTTHLSVLCHTAIQNLLHHNPHVDNFYTFTRGHSPDFAQLKNCSFDIGILLTRSFSSAWWFFKAAIQQRIGFQDHFRTPLLTTALTIPKEEETIHQVLTYKKLLEPLGISQSSTPPELFVQSEEHERAHGLLKELGIQPQHTLISINPGAAFGSAKCWPEERFIELTHSLEKDPNNRVLYFADPTGKPLVDAITTKCSTQTINLAAKTDLRTLIALISRSQVFVSNDSGPMHIAAALKTPLVAIFGSTNEIKTGPYGTSESVLHKHVACSPCYLRKCPIDFRCMKSITTDDVLQAVYKHIKR